MPGPRKFKAVKAGVIIGSGISSTDIENGILLFDKMFIKYETISAAEKSADDIAFYAANAKKRGLEAVIVVSDIEDNLIDCVAENSFAPVLFAPYSGTKKSIPQKIFSSAPFAATALNNFTAAVNMLLRIVAIRDKSLSRRLTKSNLRM